MLKSNNTKHVEFVDYNGKFPCLCMGTLTLNIDGKFVRFGQQEKYNTFWRSGGECSFNNDYTEHYITENEWIVNIDDLPDEYKKYAEEIDNVFNANVPYGCCGGCL